MLLKLLCLCFFSLSVLATPYEDAQNLFTRFQQHTSPVSRMDLLSQFLLNLPYGEGGPLGEGEKGRFDQDPLYRFDTFDCTTYVETVLSFALTSNVDEFEKMMDKIRYENSEVDYLKRNHFPSLQWIPNNVKNGILREINHIVLPESEQKTAVAIINLPGWLKMIKIDEIKIPLATLEERQIILEELRNYSALFTPTEARLNYLPISTLLERPTLLKRIPNGSVINFVRPNWDLTHVIGTHMNVSHQGLIFQKRSGTVLRHASTLGNKKVMEMPLIDYLKRFENHPTMKGIHLMQLN